MTQSQRIRYAKTQTPQVLQSKNVYHHPSNGARYRLLLDLANMKWDVLDDASGMSSLSGTEKHPHKLKIAAREGLESLGVALTVESRERKVKTNLV